LDVGPRADLDGYRVFPRRKAAGAWRWPSTSTSAEVKERVELFLYSPSGPSCPVIMWTVLYFYYNVVCDKVYGCFACFLFLPHIHITIFRKFLFSWTRCLGL